MQRILSLLLSFTLVLLGTTAVAASPATASDTSSRAESIANLALDSTSVASVIDHMDRKTLGKRRAMLERASAFTQFLRAVDDKYVDFYAAVLSESEMNALAANVGGKHFELRIDAATGRPVLSLVAGIGAPLIDPAFHPNGRPSGDIAPMATYWYECWQAFVAALAWAIGWGMLCAPLGGFSFWCSVGSSVLFPINWNDACH